MPMALALAPMQLAVLIRTGFGKGAEKPPASMEMMIRSYNGDGLAMMICIESFAPCRCHSEVKNRCPGSGEEEMR